MAKFDKNMKNDFLDSEEFYDDEDFIDDEKEEFESEDFVYSTEVEAESSDIPEILDKEENDEKLNSEFVSTLDRATDELKKSHWYVVHTYSGHENKVKVNIEKMVENRGMQDLIQEITVPTEDVVEIKDGQRRVRTRKIFPGYVIVKMVMTSESWYVIRNTQGVTGFVGQGSDPIPLTEEEVRRMGIEKVTYKLNVDVGDTVKVIDGPFDNFMGTVEEVNLMKQTIIVRISMFGRETPVELEFGQVEKML